jgi:hypothetical protein
MTKETKRRVPDAQEESLSSVKGVRDATEKAAALALVG